MERIRDTGKSALVADMADRVGGAVGYSEASAPSTNVTPATTIETERVYHPVALLRRCW